MKYCVDLFKIVCLSLFIASGLFANTDVQKITNPGTYNIDQSVIGKRLSIRVYLEGAMMNTLNNISSQGRRMMRDDLRVSPFTGQNYIPITDPYQTFGAVVNLSQIFHHVGSGGLPEFAAIPDPETVFAVTGENAIVDWVFVEIRSAADHGVVLSTRSGLLQRDGDVVDLDGYSGLYFPDLSEETFYVVLKHRNHLGVMSMLVNGIGVIDFTNPQTSVYDTGAAMGPELDYTGLARKINQYGNAVLWAGNFNADNVVKFDPPLDDHNVLIMENSLYAQGNDGAIGYLQGDIDMNSKVKYDSPGDDRNLLMAQILYYTLNFKRLVNFCYFTEQVPPIK